MIALSPTSLEIYVDPSRSTTATTPRPQKVRYAIVSNQLVREPADPVGATAPFTYGAYATARCSSTSCRTARPPPSPRSMADGHGAPRDPDGRPAASTSRRSPSGSW